MSTQKNTTTNNETIHHIPESVLINPVLLAQYAMSAGIIHLMLWLVWGRVWLSATKDKTTGDKLNGIIQHIAEGLPFDFAKRAKDFSDYYATYANPLDIGAYEPKGTHKAQKNTKPAESPKTPNKAQNTGNTGKSKPAESVMDLEEYLASEYSLSESGVYGVLSALSQTNLSGYGSAIEYAITTHDNKAGKQSASTRKAQHTLIRMAMKGEYENRKAYVEYVEGSKEESPTLPAESPVTNESAINATNLEAMITQLVNNALSKALAGK